MNRNPCDKPARIGANRKPRAGGARTRACRRSQGRRARFGATLNPRGGRAVMGAQLFDFFAEKGFFWTLAVGWMTGPPLIYLLVWSAAASGGAIGGYDRNDFVVYYLCLILTNQLTYPTTHWSTAEGIENGSVFSALLRPLPLVYGAVATELAVKLVCVPFVLAVVLLLGWLFGARTSVTAAGVLAALGALLLALVIRFLLSYILSLLAFWTHRSAALLSVNDTFVFLFAGQVAPLALFPGPLQAVAYCLPYRYLLSFPVEALMGKLSPDGLLAGFGMQLGWLVLLIGLHRIVYRAGLQHYTAVGG